MTDVPHPSYLPDLAPCNFSVSLHFDTNEVIQAKSQVMLNTLTEHESQDALKNGRSAGKNFLSIIKCIL
jgi:hypothetical protein